MWRKLTSKLALPASPNLSPLFPSSPPNLSSFDSVSGLCDISFRLFDHFDLLLLAPVPAASLLFLTRPPLTPAGPSYFASCAHHGQQHGNRYRTVARATPPFAHKRPRLHTNLRWLDRKFDDVQAISGGGCAAAVRSGGFLSLALGMESELTISVCL